MKHVLLFQINDDVVMHAIQTIHVWFPNWMIPFREDLQVWPLLSPLISAI
jgi:hypothetical protein